jgi:biotin carboxyl carrier protein
MRIPIAVRYAAVAAILAGAAAAGWLTRDTWRPWLAKPAASATAAGAAGGHDHAAPADRVALSPQAAANLHLVSEPLKPQTYWRSLQVPGIVVERPGQSDRGISAPMVGVVTHIHALPGDTVRPGDPLVTLRLISEYLQNTQSELFKTTRDVQLTQEQKDRLAAAAREGTVPEARVIEIDQQLRRLAAAAQSYRQDLLTRGLSPEQVAEAAAGKFATTVRLVAPRPAAGEKPVSSGSVAPSVAERLDQAFEVQELKVDLGQQVQAGQAILILANHQSLYIEGQGFNQEAALFERAAQQGWAVQAEFAEDAADTWPPATAAFRIHHLSNTIDPASRTLSFYLPLANQSRSYDADGRTFLIWRYRPGQRVRLHVPVERFDNVFVLPAEAVAREGPEVYVFRQNGDGFDRKPVRLLYEDRRSVVLANDGSVAPGQYVAQNRAASLNRVLKAKSASGLPAGVHVHADGTVHGAH